MPLSRLHRISLEQYQDLIQGLLKSPSGGRFPVLLVEATFFGLKAAFQLNWNIEVQGINVADRASAEGGDIVLRSNGNVVLAAEITERPIDKSRVISTFQTKIAPNGVEDYLFFVKTAAEPAAMAQARQYFSQGHEVNFFEISNWILQILATIGTKGRAAFNATLVERLTASDIPAALKVAWNHQIESITAT